LPRGGQILTLFVIHLGEVVEQLPVGLFGDHTAQGLIDRRGQAWLRQYPLSFLQKVTINIESGSSSPTARSTTPRPTASGSPPSSRSWPRASPRCATTCARTPS
jgi:hypothetical protein